MFQNGQCAPSFGTPTTTADSITISWTGDASVSYGTIAVKVDGSAHDPGTLDFTQGGSFQITGLSAGSHTVIITADGSEIYNQVITIGESSVLYQLQLLNGRLGSNQWVSSNQDPFRYSLQFSSKPMVRSVLNVCGALVEQKRTVQSHCSYQKCPLESYK